MLNILIVDDEPLTRHYLTESLPRMDARWRIAGEAMDGQEAVDVLMMEPVDLIITDIKMPGMNGLELCRWIAEHQPDRRIVVLSGYDEFSLAQEAMRYGVQDYLLKPIVEAELASTVRRAADSIRKQKDKELAYSAMRRLSEESRRLFIRQLLRAIVSDSHVEIKSLYPLLFRFKLSLIESLGLMMIVSLDEASVLVQSIPPRDISLFKFILNQIAEELADDVGRWTVFLDGEQNTVILVTGDDEADMTDRASDLFARIAAAMRANTRLTVTGVIGPPAHDVLQLGASYQEARLTLVDRVLAGGDSLYAHRDRGEQRAAAAAQLEKAVLALKSSLPEANDMTVSLLVKAYTDLFPDLSVATLLRGGVHLISELMPLLSGDAAETAEAALNRLQAGLPADGRKALSKEEAIALLKEAVRVCAPAERDRLSEHDAAARAKEYIYAHYAEPISLAQIAENIGVSAGYLSSVFHKSVGESYIKFLTRVRMEQAAHLLAAHPDIKVYDVAEKVGFFNVKHFSFVFKQHFRMPPGEYQDKSRSGARP